MLLSQYFESPIAVALYLLCVTCLVLYFWKRNQNLPPGPLGLPFFGYYPFLSTRPYLDFAKLAQRYGDVFSFRTVGGKPIIVLNGVKTIKDVLINRSEEFIGRPLESNLIEWISDGLGVTQEEGSPWKEHRRFFLQTVKTFGFGKQEIEGSIHDEIRTLLTDLKKTNGEPTDISFHIAYAVNSVISQILFCKKFEKYGDVFLKLAKGVHDLIDIFADNRFMLVGKFYEYVAMNLFPSSAKVRRGKRLLKSTVGTIVDDHVKTFSPNNLRDFVDGYLYQVEKLKENGKWKESTFTMKRLTGISMNMLMEGTESVTSAISCLLCEVSRHPEEQRKVQNELDSVVGNERLPSWLDRHKLSYLEAFIQELYRTAMPFYITTLYSNFEDTTINGYRIPRRSILIANLWTINNDPKIYPEPKKFNLYRFLDENGKKIKSEGPYPFGIGKRSCVGESLAQMEVFLIIASVLQNFSLFPAEKEGLLRVKSRK